MNKDNNKVIAIATHRGGATKTQTTLELSAWLALRGNSVLVMDTDSQANMTDILLAGLPPKGRCLPEIIFDGFGINDTDIMTREWSKKAKVDFVCNNANAARLEVRLPSNGAPKEYLLADLVAPLKSKYDYILIDTPPASELLSMSTLIASDGVIIPTLPDASSYEAIKSTLKIVSTIQSFPRLNPKLQVLGIVVGRYHPTSINKEFFELISRQYGDFVVKPHIRECTRVQRAFSSKMPVLIFDPHCSASKEYDMVFNNLKFK